MSVKKKWIRKSMLTSLCNQSPIYLTCCIFNIGNSFTQHSYSYKFTFLWWLLWLRKYLHCTINPTLLELAQWNGYCMVYMLTRWVIKRSWRDYVGKWCVHQIRISWSKDSNSLFYYAWVIPNFFIWVTKIHFCIEMCLAYRRFSKVMNLLASS